MPFRNTPPGNSPYSPASRASRCREETFVSSQIVSIETLRRSRSHRSSSQNLSIAPLSHRLHRSHGNACDPVARSITLHPTEVKALPSTCHYMISPQTGDYRGTLSSSKPTSSDATLSTTSHSHLSLTTIWPAAIIDP